MPELATRAELAALTASLQAEISASGAALRNDFIERFAAVDRQFGELRGEFGGLRGEFGELRADISRQLLRLGLTLGSMMLAMLGTILTLGFTGAFA